MSLPRYPEYRDSGVPWLDEVPAHWDVAAFKRLVEFQNGADHKSIQVDDGFPVYGSGGVFAYASEYMHDGESVLLGRKGTVDRPLYVTGKFWTVDTMYWTRVAPDACGKYCYYAALSIPFAYYSTNTALPSMTQSSLGAHLMAFPRKEEQARIATFLDHETAKIDALIAEQERLLALLAEKRQVTVSNAVTRGLDPNVPMKDSGIPWLGDVPAHWGVRRLRFVASIGTGDADTADASEGGQYPFFVRSPNVERINRFTHDCEAVFTAGDGAGVGKVFHHFVGRFCAHQRVYIFSNFRDVSGTWFFQYLRALFYRVVLEGTAKSTVDSLRRPMIADFPVTIPDASEMLVIEDHIRAQGMIFDRLISEAENAVRLLEERRSALISAAVTGKIDVRGLVRAKAS